jgi:O-antigen/teichoic acid export membrane protein
MAVMVLPLVRRWEAWARRQVAGELIRSLVRRGSAVLLLQVVGFAAQFLTGILLGRLLGASDYGRYSFAITLVVILRLATALGFPLMLLKSVAAYYGTADWAHLKGLLRTAAAAMLAAGAIVVAGVALAAQILWTGPALATGALLMIALPLLVILPVAESAAAAIKGIHRVALGQVPEILRALLYLLALLGAVVIAGIHLDARSAMTIRVAAEFLGLVVTLALLIRALPAEVRRAKPSYDFTTWRRGLLGFAAVNATYLIFQQVDIVMLGMMRPMADVGVFRMATNLVFALIFVSAIAGVVLNPVIASAWAQGKREFLQDICVRMSRIGFALTIVAYLGLMAISPILIAILGPDFARLTLPLAILGSSHVFCALMSVAPTVLLMTGGERDAAWGITGAALLNTVLNLVLISVAGIIGAAIASAVSMILLTLFYAVRAYQRTGIDSTVFRRLHLVTRAKPENHL